MTISAQGSFHKISFAVKVLLIVTVGIIVVEANVSVCSFTCTSSIGAPSQSGSDTLLPYEINDYNFPSGQNMLVGRLFLPRGQSNFPVVVYVEGSDGGNTIGNGYVRALAKGFTKENIGLFAFNKRGEAGSSGTPTDDSNKRAEDVVSAYRFSSSTQYADVKKIGIYGISQAGWVIPRVLMSLKSNPFIILVSPAGVSPGEQVTFYLQNQWRKAGIKNQDIPHATNIHRIVAHYYSTGLESDYQKAQATVNRARRKTWFSLLNKIDYRVEVPDSGSLPSPKQLAMINKSNPDEYDFYRSPQNWPEDSILFPKVATQTNIGFSDPQYYGRIMFSSADLAFWKNYFQSCDVHYLYHNGTIMFSDREGVISEILLTNEDDSKEQK